MKTIMKKSLIAALMFGTLIGFANEISVKRVGSKILRLDFNFVKKGNKLSIKEQNGATLFNLEMKQSGKYNKIFDFTELKSGDYITELEKDFEIIVRHFKVENNVVYFSAEKTIFKPVIRFEENHILFSKISFDSKPTSLSLYYKGNLIYSENTSNKESLVNRVYQLSKKQTGIYTIVVQNNDRTYTQNFKV